MPVTQDKPAPYAPASSILELIETYRRKGLPQHITHEVLQRVGVSNSLVPTPSGPSSSFDLINEQGKVTNTLEGLRKAPEGEYKDRLVEWLRNAYADVLTYVDPATDDETRVRDQFRNYNPVGQQSRMVSLFLGLVAAAGMAGEKTPQPRRVRPTTSTVFRKPSRATDGGGSSATPPKPPSKFFGGGVPHFCSLSGLLSSLPQEGETWTQARREKFIETFEAVIDFCYRVEEESPPLQKRARTSRNSAIMRADGEEGRECGYPN